MGLSSQQVHPLQLKTENKKNENVALDQRDIFHQGLYEIGIRPYPYNSATIPSLYPYEYTTTLPPLASAFAQSIKDILTSVETTHKRASTAMLYSAIAYL